MATQTNISWTDKTWNIAVGCTKVVLKDANGVPVETECKNCYMMRDMGERRKWNVNGNVAKTSKTTFNAPLKWQKQAEKEGKRYLVFTSSLTDVFHKDIDGYRDEMWEIIKRCPNLIFQILTKRPERILECLPKDWNGGYDNVWLGTSCGTQESLSQRLPFLFNIQCKIKFVSIEPILEALDLTPYLDSLDWIIVGGESGHGIAPQIKGISKNGAAKYGYRKCEIDWLLDLEKQCKNKPFFFKQLGTYIARDVFKLKNRSGSDILEFPEKLAPLQRQEFPMF